MGSRSLTGGIAGIALFVACCVPTASPAPATSTPNPAPAPPVATTSSTTSPPPPAAAYWVEATERTIGTTAEWSKVELADLDADRDIDIIFANGGLDESPGPREPTRVLINDGSAIVTDRSSDILGDIGNSPAW